MTNDERIYLRARTILCMVLGAVFLLDLQSSGGSVERYVYLFLLFFLVAVTALEYVVSRRGEGTVARSMAWMLIPDLVAIAGFTYLFHDYEDAFYPVAMLMAVSYPLVARRRDVWMLGAAVAVAYVVGHVVSGSVGSTGYILFGLKVAAIPLVSVMVAGSVVRVREREQETISAVADNALTNRRLKRRVNELQAISRITEVIHSSLDFERVGLMLVEILGEAIGVGTFSLFVVDKAASETLFSTSLGDVAGIAPHTAMDPSEVPAEHFSCRAIFDHGEIMVLFCATHEDMELLSVEDELVLGAVASELVVAVENSRLYKLTKRLAVTDELTGLFNYRELQARLTQEVDRAKRYDKHLSFLMIDIDEFKDFNDANGHIAGDEALEELAVVLRAVVREVDLPVRYGGEEFSVVLPETDAAGAFVVAEKVREAIAEHPFALADGTRCRALTVSVGLATFPTHATDKESLLHEADDALYQAKRDGKNRVRPPRRKDAIAEADETTGV